MTGFEKTNGFYTRRNEGCSSEPKNEAKKRRQVLGEEREKVPSRQGKILRAKILRRKDASGRPWMKRIRT